MQRRHFLSLTAPALSFLATSCSPGPRSPAAAGTHAASEPVPFASALEHLERPGCRLGICVFDPNRQELWGRRLDERFRMCSTFKLVVAAQVLRSADQGAVGLQERLAFSEADLVPHAPITEKHLAQGSMTVFELARAAQCQSDNVAANLLLRKLGGPAAFTRFCRELGDEVTRLDRYEPMLNTGEPADERDTTTPRASARLMAELLSERWLSTSARQTLQQWMVATDTGLRRLRAGFAAGGRAGNWLAGDKTGTSTRNCNDVACVWFPSGEQLIVAAYLEVEPTAQGVAEQDELVLARAGHVVTEWAAANQLT